MLPAVETAPMCRTATGAPGPWEDEGLELGTTYRAASPLCSQELRHSPRWRPCPEPGGPAHRGGRVRGLAERAVQ